MNKNNYYMIIDGQKVPVLMRRHARARRIVLRLSHDGSAVNLTLPHRCPTKKAIAFARTQRDWIGDQLALKPQPVVIEPGIILPVLGRKIKFLHHESRTTVEVGNRVYIGGDIQFFTRRVKDFIKKKAREEFSDMANQIARRLRVKVASITLRDTTSRWGSCSMDCHINLSWRLALAPARVARYVIAHEIAHLRHFDHSPAFWRLVDKLHPKWEYDREWLHENGAELHAYGAI